MSIVLISRETNHWPERKQTTFNIKRNTVWELIEATNMTFKLTLFWAERKQPAFTIESKAVLGIMKAVCF